jgi:hypothetical protein
MLTDTNRTLQHKSFQFLQRNGAKLDNIPEQNYLTFPDETHRNPRNLISSEHAFKIDLPSNPSNASIVLPQRNWNSNTSSCEARKCCCIYHSPVSKSSWSLTLRLPTLYSFNVPCNKKSCLKSKTAAIWISLTRFGIPYAILASVDISWNSQHSYIRPCPQAQRLVGWDSPAYQIIKDLRWSKAT